MDKLFDAVCNELHYIVRDCGYDVKHDQIVGDFGELLNERSIEYGEITKDWFNQISLRFGRLTTECLNVPEEIQFEIEIFASMVVQSSFTELLPEIRPIIKTHIAK